VAEVPAKGRDTMGVLFARTTEADRILAIARNGERGLTEEDESVEAEVESPLTSPQTTENPEDTDA
jgi:DNA gyrase subunit A